ncbi:PrsW family intramembrane metalloprotease [Mycetocola manganoxydans]|uniref:PrsW family intramembrane metalloprotease n=1 Tax=Mycetocola manganoxydans TaxID=699879 RepID=UPI0019A44D20|nr:PrsW family intramembrane metalloprotease [Mycetocola manganoxydans]GHD50160.1 protease PrsW [Mycetocola manganoxydans]
MPPRPTGALLGILGVAILAVVLLVVFGYLTVFLGPGAVIIGFVAALIPLAVVLAAVAWIDRWEPEPRLALVFAFLWGAAASVAIALLVDLGVQIAALLTTGQPTEAVLSATLQAPIVEEIAKGLGLVILYFAARRHFDGVVDGLVYAIVIAAGFAFTENIQYFGLALTEGGPAELGLTFFMRAIMSPFAHATFTVLTGIALGLAARRHLGFGAIGYALVGLVGAIFLHALWNGATYLVNSFESYAAYFVIVQVPISIALITITVLVRRHEIRLTRARLGEYAAAGWFTPAEVDMLSTWPGRRQAKAWARSLPGNRGQAMAVFTRDATRLAMTRQRMITGRNELVHRTSEAELLAAVTEARRRLLAP